MSTLKISQIQSMASKPPLTIESLEGGIYIALVNEESRTMPITYDDGAWIKTRNLNQMRELLCEIAWPSVTLIQTATYDEMIGTETSKEKLQISLNWNPSTEVNH